MSFAVLAGALCAQCENLTGFCGLTYENDPFSQVPCSPPARMDECKYGSQNQLKNEFLTNKNAKLNHERVEDKEPTSLSFSARRMDAHKSYNLTPNFEGKRGVFGLK